jgi:hypothetical protein
MENKDIKVIIPLHIFNEETWKLLKDAIESVPKEINILISCAKNIDDDLMQKIAEYKNVTIKKADDDKSDFCSLVNNGVGDTKWFSILEFDDVYTKIWFDNVKKYIDFYPQNSIFLPLEDIYNTADGKFMGNGNEAPWASSFSNELGYIDLDCLQNFYDFYPTGGIYNTDDWKELGGLKPSIKVAFWYEFLLRATYNGKKVFIIPKVGYVHMVGREGSLFEIYKNEVDQKEITFYQRLAKKEYFFKQDRNKTYNPEKKEK